MPPTILTAEESDIKKTHARIGGEAIEKAMHQTLQGAATAEAEHAPFAFAFLRIARDIALCHHERWDGRGHPQGHAGDDIPVSARLMALADVFDALTTRRMYKPPMPLPQANAILVEGRGRHFDPEVVDAFLALESEFTEVAARHADAVA